MVEPLGKENYVDLSVGSNELMAIIGGTAPLKPAASIDLTFNMDKMHLFENDAEGRSITNPVS